ncbi:hypothetical protein BpHYR1_036383 [Brachionus plicatilis]|uniref:Uncharacterized protein n=1 Tax=Brachionus plicatilis TaxID=10195 RepID=A0A3M7SNH9_BRAPC|nr:hypothetical protein BpHYR1_036383 [Brachionus plicatilis]
MLALQIIQKRFPKIFRLLESTLFLLENFERHMLKVLKFHFNTKQLILCKSSLKEKQNADFLKKFNNFEFIFSTLRTIYYPNLLNLLNRSTLTLNFKNKEIKLIKKITKFVKKLPKCPDHTLNDQENPKRENFLLK